MKKNAKLLLTLSLLGTTLFACNSVPLVNQHAEVRQQEANANTFAIINESSSVATLVGLPTSGVAGEEYSFIVSLKPGHQFNDKLTIKSGDEDVSYTVKNGTFTFTMPAGEVKIKLDTAETEFTIYSTSMFVKNVLLDSEDEENQKVANVRSTLPGTKLKFELVNSINFHCSKVMINGVEIQENEEDGYYHFTMPTRPVVISTDKIETKYSITADTSVLKLSTVKMFTDLETKEEITEAYKGQKVYLEFAYDVTKVDYKFSVEYGANGTDDDGVPFVKGKLEAKKVEGNDKLYYFEMVSSKVTLQITSEKDCSKFVGHDLSDQKWMMTEIKDGWNSSKTALITYTFDFLNDSKQNENQGYISFKDNGEGLVNTGGYQDTEFEWNFENEEGIASYYWAQYSSVKNQTIYYTDHLALIRDDYSSNWNDAFFGMKNNEYEMHVLKFDSNYRYVWVQDEDSNILESIFVCNNEVYLNAKVKDESGEEVLGSALTTDASYLKFYSATDKELVRFATGTAYLISDLDVFTNGDVDVTFTIDGTNTPITFAEAKATVKMKVSIKENATEGTSIESVKAIYTSTSYGTVYSYDLTLTAVKNEENTYTFTMPTSKVNVSVIASIPNKEKGFAQVGTYYAFGPNTYSSEETNKSATYEFTLPGDGTLRKKYISGSGVETIYAITDIENSTTGVITYTDGVDYQKLYYHNGLIVTPQAINSTDFKSVYLGITWKEGATYENVEARVHKKIDGYSSTWAASYYFNGICIGSIFHHNNVVYMGITIKFDAGSTSIGTSSSYHIYQGDTLLFDVIKNKLTSHVE